MMKDRYMANSGIGETAPNFEIPDEHGRPWNLRVRVTAGPVILVFYRGDW